MLKAAKVHKTAQVADPIEVVIEGITDETDSDLSAAAMAAAHETPGSLFGARVIRYLDGVAHVWLYRD